MAGAAPLRESKLAELPVLATTTAVHRHHRGRMLYNNSVLPQNDTFHQQFAMVVNPNYGLHVFARGANSSLFHMFQTSNHKDASGGMPMSKWHVLTPYNGTASDGWHKLIWWEDPVAALNLDGRAEIFIRITGDLDLWHMYQTNASDPLAWDRPKGPVCLCNFPPCKNQTLCGTEASCDAKGVDCHKANPADYWSDHTGFPTSNMNTHVDSRTGLVSLYYRGFDGRVYRDAQAKAGDPSKYTSQDPWLFNGIFE
jgi:hypothetical protein